VNPAYSTDLADIDWEGIDPLLKRKVLHGSSMTVSRYSFKGGGRFAHHVHGQEQITYVLSGELTFALGRERHVLKAGSIIVIPADLPHSAEAGAEGAEVLSVVSPARVDGRGIEMLPE
jgi:quercetin dioxygenase-like cupin family protein